MYTTQKCVHTKINTYSNENEYIERLSYFYLYICDKDLRHRLRFKRQKRLKKAKKY